MDKDGKRWKNAPHINQRKGADLLGLWMKMEGSGKINWRREGDSNSKIKKSYISDLYVKCSSGLLPEMLPSVLQDLQFDG